MPYTNNKLVATRVHGVAGALLFGLAILSTGVQAQVSVSDGGTPTFSAAIFVPPGVAGMSPKLSIAYAGGSLNGPVGTGWSIQGISTITRCPGNRAIDGVRSGVAFGPNDKLCLDGQRLIQTYADGSVVNPNPANPGSANPFQVNDSAGTSESNPREYRTEKDMYARVRAYGYADGSTAASGPAYFKVWTKSGQVFEYGNSKSVDGNTKALVKPYGQQVATVWAVSRISDTLGNFIDFKYEQRDFAWGSGGTTGSPALGHEWNLSEIQYGGNKVIFNYVDRPAAAQDRGEAWHLGAKNVSVRRLASITSYVNAPNTASLGVAAGAVAVKTMQLGYVTGSVSGRSLLGSITECAGDATSAKCMPRTTFGYNGGSGDAYQANTSFATSSLAKSPLISTNGTFGVLTGDFNADGLTDLLRWGNDPNQNQLWTSVGDGTFVQLPNGTGAGQFNLVGVRLASADGCYRAVVADFNGDGIPDILRTAQTGGSCPTDTNVLYIGNGDGSFQSARTLSGIDLSSAKEVFTSTAASSCTQALIPLRDGDRLALAAPASTCYNQNKTVGKSFYVLDVNGDGVLDIITTINPAYGVLYSSGDPIPTPDDKCASAVCTRIYLGDKNGNFSEISSTNLTHHSVYSDPSTPGATSVIFKPNTVDVDADGLADLAVKTGVWRSSGDGNFTLLQGYNGACTNPIDFNGDGSVDCLYVNSTVSSNGLSTSSGQTTGGGTSAPLFNLNVAGRELTTPAGSTVAKEIIVVDVNGDGRGDILRWSDDTTNNKLFLSNGDGSFVESTTFNIRDTTGVSTSENQLKKSDGTYDFVLGDFTGRGSVEILRLSSNVTSTSPDSSSNRLFGKAVNGPLDQLATVSSGAGLLTAFYYVPLTSSLPSNGVSGSYGFRYKADKTYAAPLLNVILPMYVVATSVSTNGVDTSGIRTEYSYYGLKADTSGRGLVGFKEVHRQTPGPNGAPLSVFTQVSQNHPYIGATMRSDTHLGAIDNFSSQVLSTTVNVYCDLTAASGADTTALGNARAGVPNQTCSTTSRLQRPYLLWSQESGADISGVPVPTVTTENTYQTSGDPTSIVVTTTGMVGGAQLSSTKTTSNNYLADAIGGDSWVLGRLTQSAVDSSVPDVMGAMGAPSAGSALNATSIKGTAPLPPRPPLTAAQLIPILELLLLD